MRRIRKYGLLLPALLLLAAEAIWTRLRHVVEWVVERLPIEPLKAALRRFLEWLPAYPTLLLFLVPLLATEPLKWVSYWLLAKRQWLPGTALFFGVDILRLGLVSFVFGVSRDKLLSIGWFRVLYGWTVRAHAWAHALVEPYKARLRLAARALRQRIAGRGRLSLLVGRLRRRFPTL